MGPITPVERRMAAIGVRLRSLRRASGLTQDALAQRLGITQSMVSRLEVGRESPTAAMLKRLTAALDIPNEVRAELEDQLAELAVEVSTLRLLRRRGEGWIQAQAAADEAAASTIWSYHLALVPGLLQIPEYTASMLAVMAPGYDAEAILAGRRDRQRILYDESKRLRFLFPEQVLRTRVAPVPVLRSQTRRLLGLVEGFDHIEIGVIPMEARLQAWALTGFDITDNLVEVELHTSQVRIDDPRHVTDYRELFEGLWASAVSRPDVAELLRKVEADLPEGESSSGPGP